MDNKSDILQSVAIIPARGGSKRVPRKNLALFDNKPAISIVIDTAFKSKIFKAIYVSTEDAEISEISQWHGAKIIKRPEELADDYTPLNKVVHHAITSTQAAFDAVCMILPTAVFVTPEHLINAKTFLEENPSLDYSIAVKRYESPPQRSLLVGPDKVVKMISPENFNKRSQDLQQLYYDAGLFSFGRRSAWEKELPSFTSHTKAIVLNKYESVDIDDPEDLEFAQTLYKLRQDCA